MGLAPLGAMPSVRLLVVSLAVSIAGTGAFEIDAHAQTRARKARPVKQRAAKTTRTTTGTRKSYRPPNKTARGKTAKNPLRRTATSPTTLKRNRSAAKRKRRNVARRGKYPARSGAKAKASSDAKPKASDDKRRGASGASYQTTTMDVQFSGEETGAVWGTKVKYLTEAERAPFEVFVKGGKLVGPKGNAVDTTTSHTAFTDGMAIFVMDKGGRLFVSTNHDVGKFHHSSLLAGKPAAGAGEIRIEGGVIKTLSRKSGHYKPTDAIHQQVISELSSRGIDVSTLPASQGF